MNFPKKSPKNFACNGFALIVTLSLMILLTVLAVGLLSLSSITLRSTQSQNADNIARANARMALVMALGELQTSMGPDARVSARAETLAKDARISGNVSANTPKAWWVGISHSDGTSKLTPANKDIVWLISGLSGGTLGGNLQDPVKMISSGSLDLAAFTGGSDIEAGRVPVKDTNDQINGTYAWFVNDNGMKAQLSSSHSDVINGNPTTLSAGVLPASYDPKILNGMGSVSATTAQLHRLGSIKDLEFVGLERPAIQSKFFGYTALSRGVLSDTKNGGLRKDLTIAFENTAVFSKVFPTGNTPEYLLIAQEKLSNASDLGSGGYINWGIFRDYYNLKKNIRTVGGIPVIAPHAFEKKGLLIANTPFESGQLGPHQMGSATPPTLRGHPYGTFGVAPTYPFRSLPLTTPGHPDNYKLNPIFPILSAFQQNAWLTQEPAGPGLSALVSHAQLFTSYYNPYNIAIEQSGDVGLVAAEGPRVMKFAQVLFSLNGKMNRQAGLHAKLEVHGDTATTIQPGMSQVLGFKADAEYGNETDQLLYSTAIGNIITQSVSRKFPPTTTIPPTSDVTMKVEFMFSRLPLMIGIAEHPGNREVSQVFFAPYTWNNIFGKPGKILTETFPASELGRNRSYSAGFFLRTSTEPDGKIRPLVDGNIRAVWNNPRWDSGLNLPLLASYSPDLQGGAPDKLLQLKAGPGNTGFTFWGDQRSPSGNNDRVILFDVPRRDLVSLGQLQHASAGRFSYEPSYIVGNSYANPRIPLDDWKASVSDTFSTAARGLGAQKISGSFNLYDASYLVNEKMFDSYVFTTIPQKADNFGGGDTPADFTGLLRRDIQLPNPRYIPYQPDGSTFSASTLQDPGLSAATGSFHHNAGHLLVDGSFNVNSTSVDAWEAFLSGTSKLPVGKISTSGAIDGYTSTTKIRFPRCTYNAGSGMSASTDDKMWTGFRELEQPEVRELATEIVSEIKKRGPFLTLGDFVNRRLKKDDTGKSATLQVALDKVINSKISNSYQGNANGYSQIPASSGQAAGFPGTIQQGDVLQALAPYMTVHSDTFTIRAYGEARDPGTGDVTAKAWCEAVVQRFPDPITPDSAAKPALEELSLPSSPFGRKFRVISFRWLSPSEI